MMPRPKKEVTRKARNIRMSEAEWESCQQAAEIDHRSSADWCRMVLLTSARKIISKARRASDEVA